MWEHFVRKKRSFDDAWYFPTAITLFEFNLHSVTLKTKLTHGASIAKMSHFLPHSKNQQNISLVKKLSLLLRCLEIGHNAK